MNRNRITISGYYGFRNAGDEAVLAGLIKALRVQPGGEDLKINVLSIDPAETRRSHGVDAANRYRVGPVLRSLATTDLLLSGGGSLFQDTTSPHGIFYYAAIVRLAQMFGKKTMFVAQGVGPLNLKRSQELVAGIANRLDAITVRDNQSADLLKSIGVNKPIEVTADPALLLGDDAPRPRSGIVVALRPWHSGDQALGPKLADICHGVTGNIDASTLAMQPQADESVSNEFRQKWMQLTGREAGSVAVEEAGRLQAIASALAGCEMVIGMRLHALILAAASGIPSVAIAYDPKVTAFMKSTGQEDAIASLDGDAAATSEVVKRVWENRAERAALLRERLPSLRAAAMRNAEAALQVLTNR